MDNDACAAQNEDFSISEIEISEGSSLKTENFDERIISSDISETEISASASTMVENGTSECLLEEDQVQNSVMIKTDTIAISITEVVSLKSTDSPIEAEELLELVKLQIEENEEMMGMISRAKEKLEFFTFHVEDFVKSLHLVSKNSDAKNKRVNTHLKNIYRKKLLEFASGLLDKVTKSIKDLKVDYEILEEHKKKTEETFEAIDLHHISDEGQSCTAENGKKTVENLKDTVNQLAEELYLMKPKQLMEIEKVSHIETDIEMLYDLYRRFSSIEGRKSGINFMKHIA